jgi:ABC-type methionine transport system permease subunit
MAAAMVTAVLLFVSPQETVAQCALCRTAVSKTGNMARTLNFGILVLLVPPVAIFCSIFVVALKRRKESDGSNDNH